jgi:hypothetical protein
MADINFRRIIHGLKRLTLPESLECTHWINKGGFAAKICPKCNEVCFGFKRPIDCTSEVCPINSLDDLTNGKAELTITLEVVTSGR